MASTERAGTWAQKAPLPVPVGEVGVAELGGRVYVVGGQERRTADVVDNLARHDVYDPLTDTWLTAAPLPVARSAGMENGCALAVSA